MKSVHIVQVDAFTNRLFGGNPAAVVFDAQNLSERDMQQIAREMNLSETAFVLPSKTGNFRLRYFTPEKEIRFCGHATVGSLFALALHNKFGMNEYKTYRFLVETTVGTLPMEVYYRSKNDIQMAFDAPRIDLQPALFTHKTLSECLGIPLTTLDQSKPLVMERTNQYLYATVPTLQKLGKIHYDYDKARQFAEKEKIVVFCLLTAQTFDKKYHLHSRVFGPLIGLVEDPVTGSTQGAIAAYAVMYHLLPKGIKIIGSEQGHFVGRPGGLQIRLRQKGKNFSATIFAQAVHVFSTHMHLP